ncbi:hypothetical protein AAAC51_04005 [Priestia megaterium]
MDGDIAVPHEELMKYTKAIETGHDIALNNLSWTMKRKVRPHPVSIAKYMLNLCLQREDLSIQALTAIPHAIKKTSAAKIDTRT